MNFSLSRVQFFLLLFLIETGILYITFQSALISKSGTISWVIFAIACLFHYLLLLLYERYYSYFHLNTFFQWTYKIYWFCLVATYIAYTEYVLASWVLPQTPIWVVIFIIVLLSLYANLSRPETVVNIGVILIPLIALFVVFLMLAIPSLSWTNLFPIQFDNKEHILQGFMQSSYAFIGVEMFLILRPFLQKELKLSGKPLFFYQLLIFVFYMTAVIFSLLFFSIAEIKIVTEPIIYILKSQEVTFVKRLDIFFVYIWLMWSIVTIMIVVLVIRVVHFEKKRKYPKTNIVILHVLLAIISLFLVRFDRIEFIKSNFFYVFAIFTILLPFGIIVWNKWRGKKCIEKG